MSGMSGDTPVGGPATGTAHLHLNRVAGWGLYGTLTAATFGIGMLGTVTNLRSGHVVFAGLVGIASTGLAAFLALLTHALVWPDLTATSAGISGRMPRGGTVEAGWSEVTIDVDADAEPGTLRLDIREEQVSVSARAWIGFGDFLRLIVVSPQASARLTPAARREVMRMLQPGIR